MNHIRFTEKKTKKENMVNVLNKNIKKKVCNCCVCSLLLFQLVGSIFESDAVLEIIFLPFFHIIQWK